MKLFVRYQFAAWGFLGMAWSVHLQYWWPPFPVQVLALLQPLSLQGAQCLGCLFFCTVIGGFVEEDPPADFALVKIACTDTPDSAACFGTPVYWSGVIVVPLLFCTEIGAFVEGPPADFALVKIAGTETPDSAACFETPVCWSGVIVVLCWLQLMFQELNNIRWIFCYRMCQFMP